MNHYEHLIFRGKTKRRRTQDSKKQRNKELLTLVCKSASGRTIFKAELQDILSFNEATFTIDGKSASYGTDLCAAIIFNPKNKVFTISLQANGANDGWLTFYAIPATFQEIKGSQHDEHYKFKAIIQGKDPRPDKYNSPEIELNCELSYSI